MKDDFSIIELFIMAIFFSFVVSFFVKIEMTKTRSDINGLIYDIQSYRNSIINFDIKYGFLPGDLKKTQIFDLSINNTDGNENGLIEDKEQQSGNYSGNVHLDGEVLNFWLHLYRSGFLKIKGNIFPYIDFLESGILVFTDGNSNFLHLSVDGINQNSEIATKNNLTPYQAYIIDKKIDDSLPVSGNVVVISGNVINTKNIKKISKNCSTEFEYLTVFKNKMCQIIIKL
jgi:hypothetical protein